MSKTTIRQWMKKNNTVSDSDISNESDVEIKAIKKRMAKLEQENEILHQRRAKNTKHSPYSQQPNRRNI